MTVDTEVLSSAHVKRIREHNDTFRRGDPALGRWQFIGTISEANPVFQQSALTAVISFDAFTDEQDP